MTNGRSRGATEIARFLLLDGRMPRSLAFCYSKIGGNLGYLEKTYGTRHPCHDLSDSLCQKVSSATIDGIFEEGLHDFLQDFRRRNAELSGQIEQDFRFYQ
jgi:uncharacterized alpha-E superfamily protein